MDQTNILRLCFFIIGGIAMLFLGRWWAKSMLYPTPHYKVPESAPEPWRTITLPDRDLTSDGNEIAWFLEPKNLKPETPVFIYFHGNGENLATMLLSGQLREWQRLSVPVLVVDYPGYGQTPGSPGEEENLQQGCRAVAWVRRHYENQPLILAGWSLGAAVAVGTAHRCQDQVSALILMSAWASLRELANAHFPQFLVRLLLTEEYPSQIWAGDLNLPVLMIHGSRDDLIPITQGLALREAFGGPVKWIEIGGAGHNDLLGVEAVWKEILTYQQTSFGSTDLATQETR